MMGGNLTFVKINVVDTIGLSPQSPRNPLKRVGYLNGVTTLNTARDSTILKIQVNLPNPAKSCKRHNRNPLGGGNGGGDSGGLGGDSGGFGFNGGGPGGKGFGFGGLGNFGGIDSFGVSLGIVAGGFGFGGGGFGFGEVCAGVCLQGFGFGKGGGGVEACRAGGGGVGIAGGLHGSGGGYLSGGET
jgi:hypothetical protein